MQTFNPNRAMDMVDDLVLEVHKETVFKILRNVISKSPVLSGTYKSNHMVNAVGSVNIAQNRIGTKEQFSAEAQQEAMSRGEAQIAAIQTGYQISTVSNSLPYADILEQGHSDQAPNGNYRLTVAAAKNGAL